MFKLCAPWAPRSLTDYHKSPQKEACSDFLSLFNKLIMKTFCHVSSMGMKHGSITLNCRQKLNGMASPYFSSEAAASAGELMATVFGGKNVRRRSDFGRHYATHSLRSAQTLKTVRKRFRRVQPQVLQHNGRPHTPLKTYEEITELG